ncbi:MAG: hypothetical protein E4H20_05370 [Spirochaetales bacterium]|nr:MAG: hypothetical protein E4H20_05370 [Spirochaetales bacterium]
MKKTTLAVPAGIPEVEAFRSEAKVTGRDLVLASRGRSAPPETIHEPDEAAPPADSRAILAWDSLSFASARAVVLEAENELGGHLDELVLFADPPRDDTPFIDATPRAIEETALSWAAGHAELIREAARRFSERGGGTVVLVITERPERGPLGSMAAGALLGLAEGLIASAGSADSSWRFIAVLDESGQPDLVARYVAKLLDEPPRDTGKVLRHSGRAGLFGAR